MGQLTNLYVSQSYQGLIKLANSTTGVTGTLQYTQDGLGNNLPLQISTSSVNITGSFTVNGLPIQADTGSLVTTASFNAFTSSIDGRVDALELETGSLQLQINQKLDTGSFNSYTSSNDSKVNSLIASTGSYATTSSLTSLSQSIALTDLSQNNRLGSLENATGSYVTETESGSFMVTGSVAGDTLTFTKGNGSQFSLQVTVPTGSLPAGVVSGSAQIVELGFATTSSLTSLSSSIASTDLGQNNRLGSLETATGSLQNQINQKLDTGSFNSYTSSIALYDIFLVDLIATKVDTGSFNSYTSSNDGKVNSLINATGSYATTGSNNFVGQQNINSSVNITGSLNVTGEITALSASITYLETIYQTSSVIFSSGSNILGDEAGDTQTLWGTVNLPTGPLTVTGSVGISGSISQRGGTIDISNSSIQIDSALNNFQVSNVGTAFIKSNGANPFSLEGLSSINNNSITFPTALNISSSVNISGSLQVEGDTTFKGNLIPSGNYVYDLGSTTHNWRSIYVGSGSIFMDDHKILGLDSINSDLQIFAPTGTSIQLIDITKAKSGLEVTSSFKVDFTGNTGNPLVDISSGSINLTSKDNTNITLYSQGTGNINITAGGSNPRNNVNIDGKINQQDPGSTPNSLKDTNITGSLNAPSITGSLQGTASYATNALSSSHAINADTASYFNGTIASASFATNAATASIAYDLVVLGKCDNPGGLTKGTIVRITGNAGDNALFNSASWEDDNNSANTLGMLTANVAYNGFANIVVQGTVIGINTDNMTAGDLLYLSSSGQYTTSSVPAPYHEVRLGQVLRPQLNNGSAYISIDNGYELSELHDVDITSPVVGDLLVYRSGSYGQWVNETGGEIGFATTGSNTFKGDQVISGSLIGNSLNDGLIKINTEAQNSSSLVVPFGYISASAAVSQSNLIFGAVTGPNGPGQLTNQSGSIVISGSNNILLSGGNRQNTLVTSGTYGYIGSSNIVSSIPTITTSSILRPAVSNNNLNAFVSLAFTTSSLQSPSFITSNVLAPVTINHQSASLFYNTNINIGGVISTANTHTLPFLTTIQQNYFGGSTLSLNHASSSITTTNNIIGGAVFTVTNLVSSSVSTTNNGLSLLNNLVIGSANGVWVSGSNTTNRRQVVSNIIGGTNTAVSSSQVGSDASSLVSSIVYGQNLIVSASHTTGVGGSTFLGRYNDATSLHLSQDIVFAVGTGTGTSNRRTGLYVTSGSLVGVSGSLDVIGNTTMTGSLNTSGSSNFRGNTTMTGSLNVSGSSNFRGGNINISGSQFNTNNYITYNGSPNDAGTMDNFVGHFMVNRKSFVFNNIVQSQLSSGSNFTITTDTTGSYSTFNFSSAYAGTNTNIGIANYNGSRVIDLNADTINASGSLNVTGSAVITGSLAITGSASGNVNALSISSNTASLDLNNGNFFTLQLVSGSATHINPSNIKPGQTINILLSTTGSGTVNFPSSVKQISGSAYVPTTTTSKDIITLVSFDSTNLYLANVKNLI